MEESSFRELYNVQRRIKDTKTLSKTINNSIDPEIESYDKDLTIFLHSLQQANLCIWNVIFRDKGISITELMQNLPEDLTESPSKTLFGQISATTETSTETLHEIASKSECDAFCHIQALFQYVWCKEKIDDFLKFIESGPKDAELNLIQGFIANPLIWNYFGASLQPIFRILTQKTMKEIISATLESLINFSVLIPDFFCTILRTSDNPRGVFWNVFLSKFVEHPFLFNLCSLDFEVYHKEIHEQYITDLGQYFESEEADSFIEKIFNTKSAALYPSASLFEEISNNRAYRLLLSPDDSSFFGEVFEFPEITSNTLFLQEPLPPQPKPFSELPKFIDIVIDILSEAKLIFADTQNTPKAALMQIIELGAPQLSNKLDDILRDLSKVSLEELCKMINEKLTKDEEHDKRRIRDTIVKYSSQAALVRMLTNSANNIITNAKVLSFVENPTIPTDISTSRAALTLSLFKSDVDCFALEEKDQKLLSIMDEDIVESKDPFILRCKQNKESLRFFANEINLITKGDAPLEVADRIITAMGWLSEFIFSNGEEEAGADCVVPLTILAICVARPTWLASVISVIEEVIIPKHQANPIFPHTDYFFISTFSCAGGFIVSKLEDDQQSQ